MDNFKIIGEKIKKLRKERKWTQEKLSEVSGVDRTAISYLENGKTIPHESTLRRLAQALKVDVNSFLNFTSIPEQTTQKNEDMKTFFRGLLIEISDMVPVPILSSPPLSVKAGTLLGGNALDYIKMPKVIANSVDYAMQVKGMSLLEAGIFEGSLIFVKAQIAAEDGAVVVAKINDAFVIKKLRKVGSESWLEPVDRLGRQEFEIRGVVKHVLHTLSE